MRSLRNARFVRKPVIAEFLNSVCSRAKRPFTAESSVFLVQTAAQRRLAYIWAKHLYDRVEPILDLHDFRSIGQNRREADFGRLVSGCPPRKLLINPHLVANGDENARDCRITKRCQI
jgi:hypothetical protein